MMPKDMGPIEKQKMFTPQDMDTQQCLQTFIFKTLNQYLQSKLLNK